MSSQFVKQFPIEKFLIEENSYNNNERVNKIEKTQSDTSERALGMKKSFCRHHLKAPLNAKLSLSLHHRHHACCNCEILFMFAQYDFNWQSSTARDLHTKKCQQIIIIKKLFSSELTSSVCR